MKFVIVQFSLSHYEVNEMRVSYYLDKTILP